MPANPFHMEPDRIGPAESGAGLRAGRPVALALSARLPGTMPRVMRWLFAVFFFAFSGAPQSVTAGESSAASEDPRAGAKAAVRVSFVESYRRNDDAAPVTAIGLRMSAPATAAPPMRLIVLVDTSASQMGEFHRRGQEALHGMLEAARPEIGRAHV